jgi:hypothetical protein
MPNSTSWAQLERCNAATATGAPELLVRTATCSQQALDGIEGDPFTAAYAAEVKRCGTTALEDMALSPAELDRFISLACRAAPACGQGEVDGCRSDVTARLGKRLGRAVGALNAESRIALRRCLQAPVPTGAVAPACESAEDRIAGCLDPMLDRLLWTPD